MAVQIKQGLPLPVQQLIGGHAWKGGPLVQLADGTMSRAVSEDVVLNYAWVKPFVAQFNDRVPSGFYITDVFLMLDRLYFQKLLIPLEEGESKETLAASESKKIKLLVGCLRALWRSSTSARYRFCFWWESLCILKNEFVSPEKWLEIVIPFLLQKCFIQEKFERL